jgi:acyl-CoA thioesterase-1
MKLIFSTIALLLSLLIPLSAMANYAPKVIHLAHDNETWEIGVVYSSAGDRISFKHTVNDQPIKSGILETGMASDIAPTAVLIDGIPLLVWSSTAHPDSDSDLYYARWAGSGWSNPQRVHANNDVPDMAPNLYQTNDGGARLYWYRNTGDDVIIQWRDFTSQGELTTPVDSEALFSPRARATDPNSADDLVLAAETELEFYASMTPREADAPLVCIALGDSITAGLKRTASGHQSGVTSPPNGGQYGSYTEELISLLLADVPSAKIYNWGVHGDRSYQGVSRISSVMSRHADANCILIMFGANDIYASLSPNDTKANMKLMAERARNAGITPIIATLTPNTTGVGQIGGYYDKVTELAEETGLSLADQYVSTHPARGIWLNENTSGDGLHLSNTGDLRMAEEWDKVMRENPILFPVAQAVAPIMPPIYLLLLD